MHLSLSKQDPVSLSSRLLSAREGGSGGRVGCGGLGYYLWGQPFQLVPGRVTPQWLLSRKDHDPQVMWWDLSLQPYRFEVLHRPSADHPSADCEGMREVTDVYADRSVD